MREIIKSLGKRKLANLLILLQVILSLLYFYNTAVSIQKVFHIYEEVPKTLQTNTEQIVMAEVNTESGNSPDGISDGVSMELFQTFLDTVKRETKIEQVNAYHNSWLESEAMNMEFINAQEVDWDIDWIREIEVDEGRGFKENDFDRKHANGTKEHPYPLLIGRELKQKYSLGIGEKLSDSNNQNYVVAGILKKDSLWFEQSIPEGMLVSLDNQAVMPFRKQVTPQMFYYFKIPENVSGKQTAEKIESIAERYQIFVTADTISDRMKEQFDKDLKENLQWLCFSLTVLVMIAIGLATIILARMYSRGREIGIRMALGYSFERILRMLTGEVFLLVLSGWILVSAWEIGQYGRGIDFFENARIYNSQYISPRILLLGGLTALLMCLPAVITLFIKFRKLQPNSLIGGNE